jgi:FkbM family methyltransferase
MAASAATRLVQGALSWAYRGVRRSGLMNTAAGRGAFERAYWAYKSLIEARELSTLRAYVQAGSTVVDVGANIGFFALRFADWVGAGGRVVAIEPESVNVESLRGRVRRRGLEDRIAIVNAAAIEAPGRVFLQLNPDSPADHRVAETGTAAEAVSVDTVLEGGAFPAVSLIKIDVQGAELRVLRGARRTIARSTPALFVEFHEESLVLSGTSSRELLAELRSLGYVPHLLAGNWRPAEDEAVFGAMQARGYVDVLLLGGRRA